MPTSERDDALQSIERLVDILTRVAGLKGAGKLDEALAVVRAAGPEIFGPHYAGLARADSAGAAKLLASRERIGVYASLFAEEAGLLERKGAPAAARALYRRALELQIEASRLGPRVDPRTRDAIRALRPNVDESELPEGYRAALGELLG